MIRQTGCRVFNACVAVQLVVGHNGREESYRKGHHHSHSRCLSLLTSYSHAPFSRTAREAARLHEGGN